MKVKHLKKLIENIPDDTEILVSGYDHSYNEAECLYIFVEKSGKYFYEYYDDANMKPNGVKEKHLVIA